ncbi:hypothetical protein PAND9192_00484 [Photobacterium andalusiense]|uniref:Uncharacterized protein n=1 Tax=Photobacterium andalusiense TaxID=2204296 RepID=A0A1Y6M7J2_9GAMM|nr:hypothetical protein PAND9192_00484 [Photobacterium andalusiense]
MQNNNFLLLFTTINIFKHGEIMLTTFKITILNALLIVLLLAIPLK